MSRAACLLALLVVLAGQASADPTATLTVGPGEPSYYLKVRVFSPEAPHESKDASDDCAAGARPDTAREGVAHVVEPYTTGEVPLVARGTTAPYVPGCVAAPLGGCRGGVGGIACDQVPEAYASYDVATGRYYLFVPAQVPSAPFSPRAQEVGGTAITGTTGLGAEGDCETCPPPFSL